MTAQRIYRCAQCERQTQVNSGDAPPECCGQKMVEQAAQPMDQCTLSSTPEHSRFDDTGEPCDDGRAG